jgi:hypothetical protein
MMSWIASVLPPIELHQPTDCNCFNLPINLVCLDGHSYTPNDGRSGSECIENKIKDKIK